VAISHHCDMDRSLNLVKDLLRLDGISGQEEKVSQYVLDRAMAAGLKRKDVFTDSAHRRSPLRGSTGNLILTVPGSLPGPRRLLAAHMDTVLPAAGSIPELKGNRMVDQRGSCLGADDRSGVATILYALETVLLENLPHPPLTFLFTVQEEVGLYGARFVSQSALKRPEIAFSFDGGDPALLVTGAPSQAQIDVQIFGVAAHAGAHPEDGLSALLIASEAIQNLEQGGWTGAIRKGKLRATSNLGYVEGGEATNIVMPEISLRGEARSHSEGLLERVVSAHKRAFEKAVKKKSQGRANQASVRFRSRRIYNAFRLAKRSEAVRAALRAAKEAALAPRTFVGLGGLDANWLNERGIPCVTLGSGAYGPHSAHEYLDLEEFHTSCEMAVHLATGA